MYIANDIEERFAKRKFCFIWTRVLLSASLTLTVSAFTIIFTIQEDIRDRVHREQQQRDMNKIRTQLVYDTYLNDISSLLLSNLNDSTGKIKSHIRSKTLNALLHIDATQKTDIILFLYENYLIRSNYPELALDLSTADLNNCQFKHPCKLEYLYLPNVLADSIVFNRCKLRRAVFNGSSMVGANFIYSHASGAYFDGVNLTNAIFTKTNNLKINFANAILVRTSFNNGPNLQNVNLMNADLFQSDLTDEQFAFVYFSQSNTLLNTRFPNGSFSPIDSSQLIRDGGAELSVSNSQYNLWNV